MGYPMQTLPGPRSEPMKPEGVMAQPNFQARAKLASTPVQINEYHAPDKASLRAKTPSSERTESDAHTQAAERVKPALPDSGTQAYAEQVPTPKSTTKAAETTRHTTAQSYGASSASNTKASKPLLIPNPNQPNGIFRGI
ncbi:MAG: hypothetical protein VX519_09240 [Myxococcota bacterium]|nr:hypothetical protein [Myxococcota bacterium]